MQPDDQQRANEGTNTPTVGINQGQSFAGAEAPIAPAPSKKPSSRKMKLFAIVVGIVLLLGAGSAAAYYGVVVPNKPENIIKTAIANTLQEKQINYQGTIDMEAADKSKADAMKATSITFKAASDTEKQALKAELSVTVSGVKVEGEARYLDQAAYVKVADLGAVKSMANAYSPELGASLSKIENQWIEIDKTLVKQANADCTLDTKLTISDDELKMLSDAYDANRFATVKSKSSEAVNGKDAIKFELSIDDNKLGDYAVNFNNLSVVKKLKECAKDTSEINFNGLKDNDTTPLTLWIDKDTKRIVKVASHSTSQDAQKDNFKGKTSIVLSYGNVSIEKPEGAKPLMNLVGELIPAYSPAVQGANSSNPLTLLGI